MSSLPEFSDGKPNSGGILSLTRKKILAIVLSTVLLVAAIGLIAGIAKRNSDHHTSAASAVTLSPATHAVLKSSCSVTLYPDLCYSAIAEAPGAAVEKLSGTRDVIEKILNLTKTAVEHAFFKVEKLMLRPKLKSRQKTALHDCLEVFDETLDELKKTDDDLKIYPGKKSLSQHADDLKILLSAAMTNQESCLDGFSHDKGEVKDALEKGLVHVFKMISNALALVKNMTDADIAAERLAGERRLEEEETDSNGFPAWMSAGDRRLLQSGTITPNVVVAADGSGNYRTVTAAVAAAPEKSSTRYVIRIKAGVYRENVEVPKKKTNIMFLGDGRTSTIITGSRNVVDGSTTFHSATVAVVGDGFMARDITFQNTAGPSKHQAVALRVGSDLSAFYRCDVLAYQDTLYVHNLRQFYRDCLIAGTVDFIFGNAAAVFQNCDIHARRPNSGQKNMVTAQGRDDPNQNTGISIHNCRIGGTSDLIPVKSSFPTYLGRPWKRYSRTVIMQTTISDVVNSAGWHIWDGDFALDTLYYAEFMNTGAGSGTANRVKWKGIKTITRADAQKFTVGSFIQGDNWLKTSGIPYTLGL